MISETSLAKLSKSTSIDNLVLFISDSTRYDYLPKSIDNLGVTAKAISPSTFTASSLPSILTGKYPTTHRVWGFGDTLPDTPVLLKKAPNAGISIDTMWSHIDNDDQKPPISILKFSEVKNLSELDEPFVFVVHDKGGHAPYGDTSGELQWGSVDQFYRRYIGESNKLLDLYRDGIKTATRRFLSIYNMLEERKILENTLIVFTSDHGEILGESKYGGAFGHGHPLVPEVVSVPIVFAGAGLPVETIDPILSGVDILPTVMSALGRNIPDDSEGKNLWTGDVSTSGKRLIKAEVWKKLRYNLVAEYAATSVWNTNGGIVLNDGSLYRRCLWGLGTNIYNGPHSPLVRHSKMNNIASLLKRYAKSRLTYGSPQISADTLQEVETSFTNRSNIKATKDDRPEPDKENLRKLGYLQ